MTQADSVHSTPPTNTPIDTTRRRFLSVAAGGAIAPGIPAAALADAPTIDPIIAAIDEHRKAHAAHLAAIDELSRLEKIHGDWDGSITEKPCDDDCDKFRFPCRNGGYDDCRALRQVRLPARDRVPRSMDAR